MEPAKWQRSSAAKVAGSAVLACAVLVGVVYFLHDESQRFAGAPSLRTVTVLEEIIGRCDAPPTRDQWEGRDRMRCGSSAEPQFTLEIVEESNAIHSAKLAMPMLGTSAQRSGRIQLGLQMFGFVAGAEPATFLPSEDIAAIGTRRTRTVFEGRAYTTGTPANVALVFAVTPPEASPPLEK